MKQTHHNRGFILLLVIAMIPLMGMVIALLGVRSRTLAFETRRALLQAQADNACESGLAWAQSRRDGPARPAGAVPLPLEAPAGTVACAVTWHEAPDGGLQVTVTAQAADARHTATTRRHLRLH